MALTSTPSEEAALTGVEAAFPTQRGRRGRPPLAVSLVARAGGAAVVWLAVFVPVASQRPVSVAGLGAVAIAAAIWAAALRHAFAAGQATVGTGLSAATGSLIGLVAVAAIDPWFPQLHLGLPTLIAIAAGIWATASTWEWFVGQTSAGSRSVLVVGTNEVATAVAQEVGRARGSRFDLIGRVGAERTGAEDGAILCLGRLPELRAVMEAQRPDIVVLTDERTYAFVVDRLLDVAAASFRVVGLASFFEYAFGRVPLSHLTPAWFMGVLHLRQPVYARWSKRAFDLLVASAGLVVVLPLLPVIALLVRCTDGPIIYKQLRLGEGGRAFTIYKFRTMVCDAEASGRAQWAADCDRRVTRVGAVLRRSHLDEIPQLWNVLKGDMSIVGPRPERPEFVEMLETGVPFWSRRLLIKPGVTGWAQIKTCRPADCESSAEKLSYDLWYLRHRNLAVDIAVCVKTAGLVMASLFPSGALPSRLSARLGKGADL